MLIFLKFIISVLGDHYESMPQAPKNLAMPLPPITPAYQYYHHCVHHHLVAPEEVAGKWLCWQVCGYRQF